MYFYTYILKSQKHGRYYIGHCEDMYSRLGAHNKGKVRSTKPGIPWKVVYMEKFIVRAEAYRRELRIKSFKGGAQFHALLNGTIRKR